MRSEGQLLDAIIEIDKRHLRLQIECNIDDEQGVFLLPIRISEEGKGQNIIASGELKISVVNPLGVTAVVLFAAGTFGFCMLAALSVPVYELFEEAYQQSKKATPKCPLGARVTDLYLKVRANIGNLIKPAKKAILPCAITTGGRVAMKLAGL